MFFILGWSFQNTTSFGGVKNHFCKKCDRRDLWQLSKVSTYFTLFFIPLFPHSTRYTYDCPICNQGITLDKKTFSNYKAISQINQDFDNGKIDSLKQQVALEEIEVILEKKRELERISLEKESVRFDTVVSGKKDEELIKILIEDSQEYHQAFIISIQREVYKRKIIIADQTVGDLR